MLHLVELALLAQAAFAVLLLAGAWFGHLSCRRHQLKALNALRSVRASRAARVRAPASR